MISILCDDDDDDDEKDTAARNESRREDYRTLFAPSFHYRTSYVYSIPVDLRYHGVREIVMGKGRKGRQQQGRGHIQ